LKREKGIFKILKERAGRFGSEVKEPDKKQQIQPFKKQR